MPVSRLLFAVCVPLSLIAEETVPTAPPPLAPTTANPPATPANPGTAPTVVVITAEPPAQEWTESSWTWAPLLEIEAGSSRRVDHGLIRQREDGAVIDGWAGVLAHHHGRGFISGEPATDNDFILLVGTDRNARESGEPLVAVVASERSQFGPLPVNLYDLDVGIAYSRERRWIADAELYLGPLHLAAGREDTVHEFRLGFGIKAHPQLCTFGLTVDRVIGYIDSNDRTDRHLSTQVHLTNGWRVAKHLALIGDVSYVRSATTEDGERTSLWTGSVALMWGF